MEAKIISKKRFGKVIDAACEHAAVFAPRRSAEGVPVLARIHSGEEVDFDYRNLSLSLKGLFLPQRETLLEFEGEEVREPEFSTEPLVIFGARPCDVHALECLDRVFLQRDPVDPYYRRRREQATLVVFTCLAPQVTCFCTSVGGSPGKAPAADVLATDLGGDILLFPQTDKGRGLLDGLADLLGDADDKQLRQAEQLARAAQERMEPLPLERIEARLGERFEDPLWSGLGEVCLACGACAYLCPTCHCFDITDEVSGGRGVRVRTWDCCAYPLFTQHASGHNPRPTQKERWRQRVMHKFRYAQQSGNRFLCVGCGRCIRHCPASLDLRVALQRVMG